MPVWSFVRDYGDIAGMMCAVIAAINYSHWPSRSRIQTAIAWIVVTLAVVFFLPYLLFALPYDGLTFHQTSVMLVSYAAGLYGVICNSLRFGWAARLTKWRGEKWVKELDYVYLLLGAVGIIGSINKLGLSGGRYTGFDLLGPIVLTTALVIRLVKTRADIEAWNKV